MKKTKQILTALFLAVLVISVLCVPAFALTESEVEAQIASSSKEAVTGNVLLWFLCAVAFLKVSQKIDSFMATLGVNVGRTGGSMLAEAMIAMRAVTMVVGGGHGAGAGGQVLPLAVWRASLALPGWPDFSRADWLGWLAGTSPTARSEQPQPRPPPSIPLKIRYNRRPLLPQLPRRRQIPALTARYTLAAHLSIQRTVFRLRMA